jgi:ParB family transcriptional regulator, chromosome partitioning protein
MQTLSLPLTALVPDESQPRRAASAIEFEALVASIRKRGLLLPLRVRPADREGQHLIVSGHRRHAALLQLGVAEVLCVLVEGPLDEATILAEQLAENLHRENLNPLDEAEGYRRYLDARGIPAARAAEELQVPPARISRALALLDLPEELREGVRAGRIPKDAGYHLSRLPEGSERQRLFAQALAGSLSRDTAARAAQAARREAPESIPVARVACKLPEGRSLTLVGAAITLESLIKTLEDFLKEARKAHQQGWDVTTLAKVCRDRAAASASPGGA